MQFASFEIEGRPSWGFIDKANVVDLGAVIGDRFVDLKALIAADAYQIALDAATTAPRQPFDQIKWRPVLPNPGKILCVGHNYETHRIETGRAKVGHPSIFVRFADTLTGHQSPIVRPRVSNQLDFEGELAIVIGKCGRRIAEIDAMSHIAGITCANDASVRDWQWHTQQFTPGKNFPSTCALGPSLVQVSSATELDNIRITTRLNGAQMQDAPISDMIFPIPTIVSYVSSFTPLAPGDVILTGTPGGVGGKREPPIWMKAGDVIDVEISGVGRLTNPIEDEV